tara:strand:- start:1949 stop:2050 length:102 start_codon:yes stop_codon:yes gene_type:complete
MHAKVVAHAVAAAAPLAQDPKQERPNENFKTRI